MATPDLSALPDADVQAIASGDMSKVSEPSLHYLAGNPMKGQVKEPPAPLLAGPVGGALESAASALDPLATTASQAAAGVVSPPIALAARLGAVLLGHDPDAAAAAVHNFFGGYKPPTAGGQATAADLAVPGQVAQAAGNATESATGIHPSQLVEDIARPLGDVVGSLPELGAARELAPVAEAGEPVARSISDIADAAGYRGLAHRGDMKSPGATAITDQLISHEAGLPEGQAPTVATVQSARNAPARVFSAAQSSLPPTLTQDSALQGDLQALQGNVSQLPRSPDVDALQQHMLSQPQMSSSELFSNISAARQRAGQYLSSDNPDQVALGGAYSRLANAYEEFAGRQLQANPGSTVSLPDFQAARTAFAKNYLAEAALKGGEHFDPGVFGRAAQADPNLLTGNSAIVAKIFNTLPPSESPNLARGIGAAAGAVVGTAGEHALGHMTGMGPAGGAIVGAQVAPAIQAMLRNLFTRGNPEAAATTATNPALSYFFGDRGSPFTPGLSLARPPGEIGAPPSPQGDLGSLPQGPGARESLELTPPAGTPGVTPSQIPLGQFDQGPGARESLELTQPPGNPVVPAQRSLGPLPQGSGAGSGPIQQRFGAPEAFAPNAAGASRLDNIFDLLNNNGSSENNLPQAGSLEGINRAKGNIVETDGDTAEPVLADVTQVDRNPRKGHIFVNADTGQLVNSGGMRQSLALGILNRFLAQQPLGRAL